MSMELLFIDTGFQDRKSDLQDSKSNWTSLFRIVPASDEGTSKSRKLFELVLRLKKLEVKYHIILHVMHVSGKRMIAQGTDGLSREEIIHKE